MASIVPKIKIGLGASKREKHNLSFDCATTANIGSVQPTMCREMVPKSKFKVKVASLVRLASMPVPTFGRMSLRHYHTFVKYADLWQPFDAMMSGQHYVNNAGSSFIPTTLPWYTMAGAINHFIRAYSDISIAHVDHPDEPYTITETNKDWDGVVYNPSDYNDSMTEAIKAAQAADLARLQAGWSAIRQNVTFGHANSVGTVFPFGKGDIKEDAYGVINAGSFYAAVAYNVDTLVLAYDTVPSGNVTHYLNEGSTPITREGADLITEVGDYIVYFKFKPFIKRLRTIIIGLGDQFSPYSTVEHSLIKLFAYYKAWFNLFSPNRERAFIDTPCYKLIKYLSDRNGAEVLYTKADFRLFIEELGSSCYYYLPMDYYSMSVIKPEMGNQDTNFSLHAGNSAYAPNTSDTNHDLVTAMKSSDFSSDGISNVRMNQLATVQNPLAIKLAFRMLKWANKNTVIGRSVRQYLKVHFGVDDVNAIDDGGVYRIGASRTNIQISDVMSTAESKDGYLGEYAGRGIGYGDSESFDFTADNFGCWITLTAVVPESGYYQGYLKENRHLTRYQFFNPEYDALGYQVLERGEIMDDYNCDGVNWNPVTQYNRTAAFGFVPRYSEYKVGRNIVNGDLSLVGLYGSMAPYTLDRRIAGGEIGVNSYAVTGSAIGRVKKPTWVPQCVYDAFRRIDPTDHLGQYNRIFNYGGNDLDHFIINNVFDVQCWAPMKSLTDSFDTVSEDEKTVKLTHS